MLIKKLPLKYPSLYILAALIIINLNRKTKAVKKPCVQNVSCLAS
jgi:hypothetical protein